MGKSSLCESESVRECVWVRRGDRKSGVPQTTKWTLSENRWEKFFKAYSVPCIALIHSQRSYYLFYKNQNN